MTTKTDWTGRVGESWAREWMRTDRSFGGLTDQLVSRARPYHISRILDVGCGAGELSLALARSHPAAEVVGVDISEAMLEVARSRSGYLPNVDFELADVANWQRPSFFADLIISRHGVMFFDDPVAAFSNLASLASREARLLFSCFRSQEENAWAERVEGFLPPGTVLPPDRFSPGPFAFADPAHVTGILRDAGWRDIMHEPVDFAYVAGAGADPVADALEFFQTIGPVARALQSLEPAERAHFFGRLSRYLRNNSDGGIVALRAGAWIFSARPPSSSG